MKPVIFIIVMCLGCAMVLTSMPNTASAEGKTAVIVVDLQGDFTTYKSGSLAVNGTDEAFVEKVKAATKALSEKGYSIYATQDWHPADHVSFFSNHEGKKPFELIQIEGRPQVLWPPHCVQGTQNARILVDNNMFLAVVKKGQDTKYDSYSGFKDDGGANTEMTRILKANDVTDLIVYGIATDYCVKATAVDAANAGFNVTVIEGLCKGVAPDTTAKASGRNEGQGDYGQSGTGLIRFHRETEP